MPNPEKSKFIRKAKKKGHYETKERFKALPFIMLENTTWRSLNGNSIKIYLEICRRYNGSNNGNVSFSYNEGVELFGMGKSTISRSLKQLEVFGFIKRNKVGTFFGRKATSYFITNERTNNTPPTYDWKNFKQKTKPKKFSFGFKTVLKEAYEEVSLSKVQDNNNIECSK